MKLIQMLEMFFGFSGIRESILKEDDHNFGRYSGTLELHAIFFSSVGRTKKLMNTIRMLK
jgi:hypothetical protein